MNLMHPQKHLSHVSTATSPRGVSASALLLTSLKLTAYYVGFLLASEEELHPIATVYLYEFSLVFFFHFWSQLVTKLVCQQQKNIKINTIFIIKKFYYLFKHENMRHAKFSKKIMKYQYQ